MYLFYNYRSIPKRNLHFTALVPSVGFEPTHYYSLSVAPLPIGIRGHVILTWRYAICHPDAASLHSYGVDITLIARR